MNTRLDLDAAPITVRHAGRDHPLPFSLADLAHLLTPYPPNDAAWETAIMRVEDGISPLRDTLHDSDTLTVSGRLPLGDLPKDAGGSIGSATLETAYAVLAGYRYKSELPPLPESAAYAAEILLLREWMHHLGYRRIAP